MFNKKNNVLVTGGAGFIGSHIIDLLVGENKYNVCSLDNYATFDGEAPKDRMNKSAKYLKCDIRDFGGISEIFKKLRPKYVFHTAALARIQPSIKNPHLYLEVNSLGTLNLLKAARESGTKRVIYSASSSAYGKNKIPYKESMTPDPLNPYAKTKLDGEQWMRIFSELHGLETASLRYFNVYGPRNTYAGPYTTVITRFLHLFRHKAPMTIVGDGKQTRDYTHVTDVARANYLAALSKKIGNGEVINIGCGERHSVNKIAELVGGKKLKALLANGSAKFVPARPGEAEHTLADHSSAKKLLGWSPQVKFSDGISELRKFYKLP
ncbi:hypothetical protein A2W54_02520 [Candidatus Giovannonibacteria bacterium RIFCSPHIGHO2_02_43_13]|uniref:NAD(P)-binding domain-containing protein n=1 Tax=Candidatus Giovannonibacteria bacterium RIFCSPHIGHO2_02_43_13 TaxID=1798330 RepID=A0A1F5WPN1_9BACT|nr:MAG: Nucleotide sugar epimerase [Parcubacteria group bacterium GW2011_GWA2_44_13]OGF73847.1 MAG: hypothetical protein A3E06_01990 [Candidatus Giovannonibacteria bacterium RIFCSPHIGHO2_12_FULL_44_42]OGF77580.1 MAG: hypothetical protein A2W54_02520 [Candidatus Giovannonibacteria bacterium RIFCSPHIGHO2_02_43_13]OGF90190.1 MAG: hypothetical protein A3I94_00380 [Candidatus Giovannonibacteria bacterium RIFCSPLOWO2_02_FULL_43_54]OGF97503.1 MAG: hypothetical protein A3H08_00040 [Candidatus Giovannon